MSVYCDGVHLVADDINELHQFAAEIGLKPEWFQDHIYQHYDVFGGAVGRVFRRGAICVSTEYIVFHQIGRKVKRKEMGMAK